MMRSMYSGVSGLRVHQTKMDVIANNISNINTVGFKRASVSFKDSFNQTLSSATSANQDRGGINPQQIGMGANVASIVNVMGQGAAQRTDYGSDLMIDGEGFFIVKDSTGFSFTRAGTFEVDASGNLVDPNGFNVCGWKAVDDPDNPGQQKIVKDTVTPINLYEGNNLYSPAEQTTSVEFTGNFNQTTNPTQKNTISFYDSQGNKYSINIQFDKDPATPNQWTASIPTINDQNSPGNGKIEVTVNGTEKMYMDGIQLDSANLIFNENGTLKETQAGSKSIKVTGLDLTKLQKVGANGQLENANLGGELTSKELNIDFSTVTQFNSKVTVTSETKDGNTAGNMTGYNIDANGMIRGTYSNGKTRILAQIPLANFKNPAGLEKYGNNLYKETGNSSEFDGIGQEASALGSKLQGGALEMSNVDLSYEFSEMITTQRGFQANSRIITTTDEMIQELVNLKR
ncbi:flagellar hook protein FlgE [[Clostridium] colinum]|uniref:flagellar hook protein FlgE n=1 Tax=[Clostridium] colinum TaxID=36835 RepID=UPI0020251D03|nr:flagellar hook protein FlgE [[Clostridium] colinum]